MKNMKKQFLCVSKNFLNFKAFTLAEVLITLGVIGVVAALTIPTLIKNYQNSQYVTSLKKAYSELNQAIIQLTIENGCPGNLKCTGFFETGTTNTFFGDEFVKYVKTLKNCKTAQQNCFPSNTNWFFDGTGPQNTNYDAENKYKFITANGVSVSIINYANSCNTPTYSTNRTGNMIETCGHMIIDTNGPKAPNFMGRDTFIFFITNGKGPMLYPMGGADNNFDSVSATTDQWWNGGAKRCHSGNKDGWRCAGRIMEKGWQMDY